MDLLREQSGSLASNAAPLSRAAISRGSDLQPHLPAPTFFRNETAHPVGSRGATACRKHCPIAWRAAAAIPFPGRMPPAIHKNATAWNMWILHYEDRDPG